MGQSVVLINEILANEKALSEKYEKLCSVLAHESSKAAVKEIINSRKDHLKSLEEMINKSSQCPAVGSMCK